MVAMAAVVVSLLFRRVPADGLFAANAVYSISVVCRQLSYPPPAPAPLAMSCFCRIVVHYPKTV